MSDVIIRTKIPQYILSILALVLMVDYFLKFDPLVAFKTEMLNWATIIFNFAVLVGVVQVMRYAGNQIIRPQRDPLNRYYSSIAVITFLIFIGIGYGFGLNSKLYTDMYMNTVIPVTAMLWGLNLIFSAMGVYRMMRLSSIEAFSLFICGMSYFMKEMPLFSATFPFMMTWGEWIMKYVGGAANTSAILVAALGALIVAIRTIMGQEPTANV